MILVSRSTLQVESRKDFYYPYLSFVFLAVQHPFDSSSGSRTAPKIANANAHKRRCRRKRTKHPWRQQSITIVHVSLESRFRCLRLRTWRPPLLVSTHCIACSSARNATLFGATAAFLSKSVATIVQIAFLKSQVQAFARKRTDVLEIAFHVLYAGQLCK